MLSAALVALQAPLALSQDTPAALEQPDAGRTKDELSRLFDRYPPALRNVLSLDPSLLANDAYLAPYPGLTSYLHSHPEIARNPSFYINANLSPPHEDRVLDFWREVVSDFGIFLGFGMAIGLIVWLIKTIVDYRRWNRVAKTQTDIHTKLLDRFTANDELLAYIQSSAGAKLLESSPVLLDPGPRSVAAPLGRILWSVQAGLVVAAAGIGFTAIGARLGVEAAEPMRALGILGVALGGGFVISALISYFISRRLGLIELPAPTRSA